MNNHELDELDGKILKLIVDNARIPFLEVARECNVSGAAIHQRVQKLTRAGILKGSEFIILVLISVCFYRKQIVTTKLLMHFRKFLK